MIPKTDPAKLIVLDLETYQTTNPAIILKIQQEALEKRPAQNTTKAIKELWNTEDARRQRAEDALAKTAVDPLLAEPLCVCWSKDGHPYHTHRMNGVNADEAAMLRAAASCWDSCITPDTILAGHGIEGFDLPILLNRWRRYEITPPANFPTFYRGKWRGRVFDTMTRTPCKNGLGYVSLEDVCQALGLGTAKTVLWNGEPMTGARVGAAYEAGEFDLILEYCRADVAIEEALYHRMTSGGTWGTWTAEDALAAQIAEIYQAAGLSDTQKKLAIFAVLRQAGRVPRAV